METEFEDHSVAVVGLVFQTTQNPTCRGFVLGLNTAPNHATLHIAA
jgi:hypothetical protein